MTIKSADQGNNELRITGNFIMITILISSSHITMLRHIRSFLILSISLRTKSASKGIIRLGIDLIQSSLRIYKRFFVISHGCNLNGLNAKN